MVAFFPLLTCRHQGLPCFQGDLPSLSAPVVIVDSPLADLGIDGIAVAVFGQVPIEDCRNCVENKVIVPRIEVWTYRLAAQQNVLLTVRRRNTYSDLVLRP
jgi:hypothetical protein